MTRMDVKKLVKVYNYVNDEKRPKVTLKFAAVLAAFLLSGAALVAFFLTQNGSDVSDASANATTKRDCFSLSSQEMNEAGASALLETKYAAWKAAHPGAEILKEEPIQSSGRTIGYCLTYEP